MHVLDKFLLILNMIIMCTMKSKQYLNLFKFATEPLTSNICILLMLTEMKNRNLVENNYTIIDSRTCI